MSRRGDLRWLGDLALGARMVFAGGRDGLLRTTMAAFGVGLGVALLLLAAAVPTVLDGRAQRTAAFDDSRFYDGLAPGPDTLLIHRRNTEFRGTPIRGRVLRAEGPNAPVPAGLTALPGPGELVVSPALDRLLASPDGALLRPRLAHPVTGIIGEPGLAGPNEYAYYLGSDSLEFDQETGVFRIPRFGDSGLGEALSPMLLLLIVITFVVLLLPIVVFIGIAVRFGGEHRDRRLAALRLVGADRRMIKRIAAGEALLGATLGLAVGVLLFLIGRQLIEQVTLWELSIFASDVRPDPVLASLTMLAVPAAAVGITLLALRRIVVEPLGVVRRASGTRRRIWWRLALPVAGLLLLLPLLRRIVNDQSSFNQTQVVLGVLLLLTGVVALLPWLIEAVVRRLTGGPVAWQLAVRRLQLDSGTSARMIGGIAVAVAGGIGLQMLLAAVTAQYTSPTGYDLARAQVQAHTEQRIDHSAVGQIADSFRSTTGVSSVISLAVTWLTPVTAAPAPQSDVNELHYPLLIGSCADLREVAHLETCTDGDVFLVPPPADPADTESEGAFLTPGQRVGFDGGDDPSGRTPRWTVPVGSRTVAPRPDPAGVIHIGVLATPGAMPDGGLPALNVRVYLKLRSDVPDAIEHVRNTNATLSSALFIYPMRASMQDDQFVGVRRGLYVGVVALILLLGSSLLVATLEQLRERRRLLAILVAFGTRRSTLAWSVLWQSVIPVLVGLILAALTGTALGAVLLNIINRSVQFNWAGTAAMIGLAAGVILLVTGLSLPALWRLLRPGGLHSE